MALTKPASYDMIVINESAFIATIRLVDESKKKNEQKHAPNAESQK